MSTILAATDLVVRYNERAILDSATLGIDESDRIRLVGRNGCGKTTFLKILAGLQSYSSGAGEWCATNEIVRFLVSFLGDAAVHPPLRRSPASGLMDWPEKFEVRNYAAYELGKVLSVPMKEAPDWSLEQWNDFREKMRANAVKYLKSE